MSRITAEENRFTLSGELDLTTLMAYRRELESMLPTDRDLEVDLSRLEIKGSAVLALMVFLVRHAHRAGTSLSFTGISENLRAMASLAGLSNLLGLDQERRG